MLTQSLFLTALLVLVNTAQAHPGQHDQLQQVNRHLQDSPGDQTLYIQRGVIYSEGGQYAQALADLRQAQTLGDPVLVDFQLGVLHYRMGDYDTANTHLQRYLLRFPDYAPAYDFLARGARDSGDYDLAVTYLGQYFRLQERPSPGHYLAAARMLEESGRFAEALVIIDQGQATLGVIPQLQRPAVALELQLQQPDRALARLETLGSQLDFSPAWSLDMAELLLRVDQPAAAAEKVADARQKLTTQRPTPARLELEQRAAEIALLLEPATLDQPTPGRD